ncbi:hypothetical protein AMTRI_Chr08g205030 [Amborella trichopoda]
MRQAVPLSQSEKCIVGTRLERQAAALDSEGSAIAQHEGKVIYTETKKILLAFHCLCISVPTKRLVCIKNLWFI